MNRYNEEMKLWLFDLAHGNLNENDILAGFVKHYIFFDCTIQDIKRDIIFHTNYGESGVITAVNALSAVLNNVVSQKSGVAV